MIRTRRNFKQRLITSLILCLSSQAFAQNSWNTKLLQDIQKIDEHSPGTMGVYIKKLSDGSEIKYSSERPWYLASTVKVLVAIKLLQDVEKGKISLDKKLILKESDYVDGSGETIWKEPGSVLSIGYLLEKMMTQSDSTAADILINQIGINELNQWIQKNADGFTPLTTLLQVRYDAYKELHPKAASLTNMDFIRFKKVSAENRHLEFAKKLDLSPQQLKQKSLIEAFEKYYERGLNSAKLSAFGQILEKLNNNELLSKANSQKLLSYMSKMETGEKRIKAGLPEGTAFAQKTGTQIRRFCNVGILNPQTEKATVLAVCAEKLEDQKEAESAFEKLGQKLASQVL